MATAFFTRIYNPHARITVYEASNRLGGWIDTEEVEVTTPSGEKGKVLFQRGGRMLKTMNDKPKYDDLVFWKLVCTASAGRRYVLGSSLGWIVLANLL